MNIEQLQIEKNFKSFGYQGPVYQVLAPLRPLEDGDWLLKIKILESNQEAEYRYSHFLQDPEAR